MSKKFPTALMSGKMDTVNEFDEMGAFLCQRAQNMPLERFVFMFHIPPHPDFLTICCRGT